MYDISSQYSSQVYLDQAPTLKCAGERRARQMAAHTSPAHPARVAMTTISDTLLTTPKAEQRSISPPNLYNTPNVTLPPPAQSALN